MRASFMNVERCAVSKLKTYQALTHAVIKAKWLPLIESFWERQKCCCSEYQ